MKQVMIRHACDDSGAFRLANAMTKAGAEVFSVTDAGGEPYAYAIGRFIVWARVDDSEHIDRIDDIIAANEGGE